MISGIVFSIAHEPNNLISFLDYFLGGATFAFTYLKSKTLLTPIFLHMLVNGVAFVGSFSLVTQITVAIIGSVAAIGILLVITQYQSKHLKTIQQ